MSLVTKSKKAGESQTNDHGFGVERKEKALGSGRGRKLPTGGLESPEALFGFKEK